MSFKSTVQKKLNSGSSINADELYLKIKPYKYVSFDIFDTLVKRNVENPTDVFRLMERIVGKGFADKRIRAEREARKGLVNSGRKEVTMEDIYSYFPASERKKLKDLELNTEFQLLIPNRPVIDVYNRCLKEGKTVFITSDMYWPQETTERLLEKIGVVSYKRLYLSSSRQAVKSDGSLFTLLVNTEHINSRELIHIGDSKAGDYAEPQKLGVKAIQIPRYTKNIKYRGDENYSSLRMNYLNTFINNVVPCTNDPYYKFGFAQFGKVLWGYAHWIHDVAKEKGITKLFFLARDGYIMKKAYDICVEDHSIETKYLEVSRRSLRGPILWMDYSFETILNMVVNAKLVSIESIFDGLGMDIDRYQEQLDQYGFHRDTIFDRRTIFLDEKLKQLLTDLTTDIIENSKKEYSLLTEYLKQEGVLGKFGIVDIGYAGSMQRYLTQTLNKLEIQHQITGFYLGVADFYKKNEVDGLDLDLNGYLFDFKHNPHAVDCRSSFVGLFETLFLEQGGSVKRYKSENGRVVAERYPYEYFKDGKPTEDYLKIKEIQHGAIDFVSIAARDSLLSKFKYKPSELFAGIYETGTDPNSYDLKLFADMEFYDEGITQRLAAPKGMTHYILHKNELKNDFLQCRWKTGFMKRLLKVNLPYQKMYLALQRLR
ncbi:hypothetical protein ACTNEN_07115 [Oribacterium sp. HCP28S3_H8]|uniref:hypothetical protein n=1 Tax=Oribacterium sp. HCP28S3_H8 TaxID=3438945 RepID=UPI003F8B9D50